MVWLLLLSHLGLGAGVSGRASSERRIRDISRLEARRRGAGGSQERPGELTAMH